MKQQRGEQIRILVGLDIEGKVQEGIQGTAGPRSSRAATKEQAIERPAVTVKAHVRTRNDSQLNGFYGKTQQQGQSATRQSQESKERTEEAKSFAGQSRL